MASAGLEARFRLGRNTRSASHVPLSGVRCRSESQSFNRERPGITPALSGA